MRRSRATKPGGGAARRATLVLATLLSAGACATPAELVPREAGPAAASTPSTSGPSSASPSVPASGPGGTLVPSTGSTPPSAGVGRFASSQRRTFAPQRIRLLSHGGVAASVQRVDTGPNAYLELPGDPGVTGWWVSGALAGEVYGSVVLAGHIDSRERGVGFFAKLLDAKPGDEIELTGEGLALTYVVRSNREVDKGVLSTQTDIFDRSVRGRLVLLTCTGTFDAKTRHYDHNLVVTAEPVGVPALLQR